MLAKFKLIRGAGMAVAATLGMSAATVQQAEASERWRFEDFRDSAAAFSCGGANAAGYQACAALRCGPSGAIQFFLEDVRGGVSRQGKVTSSPGFSDNVNWNRVPNPRSGGADFIASGLNMAALLSALRSNNTMGAVVNDRVKRSRGEIYFTLNGSSRAIGRLEDRCAQLAARGPAGGPVAAPPPRRGSERWEFVQYRDSAAAVSCRIGGRREICATFYCDTAGRTRFGVDGLNESNRQSRDGRILMGRAARATQFRLEEGPQGGQRLYAAVNRAATEELLERARSRDDFAVEIQGRRTPIVFTLAGATRALNQLERACRPAAVRPQTSAWRFTEFRGGGKAESCGVWPGRNGQGRQICATMYCLRDSGLQFGVDGLNENANRGPRDGVIRVDGGGLRTVIYEVTEGPERDQRIWTSNHPRPDRLADLLRGGSDLRLDVERRKGPLFFTLRGSSRALNQLEARCEEVADRRDRRRDRREGRAVYNRYVSEVVGRWGGGRFGSCAGGGWLFNEGNLSTPDGAFCARVFVSEVASGPLAGGVAILGSECQGGARARRGEDRTFETRRDGPDMLVRLSDNPGVRLGDENFSIQLGGGVRTARLRRCR